MSLARTLLARGRSERGVTLVELIAVLLILSVIITALTTLFVRGTNAELDANNRFQAQEQARIAVDTLRRELHCASAIASTSSSITVTLPSQCPSAVGNATTTLVYATQSAGTSRYTLRRAVNGGTAVTIADYLTTGGVFTYAQPTDDSLGKLHVLLPVNIQPNEGWKTWRLETDIVLRNTLRQSP